jgi:hypothetical protein
MGFTPTWMRLCLGACVGIAACALPRSYFYEPVTVTSATSATMDGYMTAASGIPPEKPRGALELTILRTAPIPPPSGLSLGPHRGLFVQLVVVNRSDEPWFVDESEQRIEVDQAGETLEFYAKSPSGGRAAAYVVGPGRIDSSQLLFPIGGRDERDLSRLTVIWTVHVGSRVISGRMPFQRQPSLAPR